MGAIAGEHVRHLSLSVGTATRYNLPVTERQANVTKFKDRHFYVIIICNIHLGLKLKEKYCHTLAGMENSSSPEALHMHMVCHQGVCQEKIRKDPHQEYALLALETIYPSRITNLATI